MTKGKQCDKDQFDTNNLRDTIIIIYLCPVTFRNLPTKYDIPSRTLRASIDDLNIINVERTMSVREMLHQDEQQHQIF